MADSIADGRLLFMLGELTEYRQRLGLSKAALAEILGVSLTTLYRWETHGMMAKIQDRNAEMAAAFVEAAHTALDEYPEFAERFVTLSIAAQKRGVTNEWLLREHREGKTHLWDFGVLGLFHERKR